MDPRLEYAAMVIKAALLAGILTMLFRGLIWAIVHAP
jgi:predicted ABC-type sugar transport system permease subunit